MRVEVFMLANSAATNGWLLNVEGGGWEHYTCDGFPGVVRGALAGIRIMEAGDFDTTPALTFKIAAADEAAEVTFGADAIFALHSRGPAAPGVESRFPFTVPFEFRIVSARVLRASVSVGDNELAATSFYVGAIPSENTI